MTRQQLLFYVTLLLVVATTIVTVMYDRNAEAARQRALDVAANIVLKTPAVIGQWQLTDEQVLDSSALRMLKCSGYVNRTYQHQESGRIVNILFFAGPSGPLVAHTPDVCMSSREFEQLGDAKQMELQVRDVSHQFMKSSFRAKTLEGGRLQLYHAWSTDGKTWQAPESPRLELGPLPFLFKVQASCSPPAVETPEQSDAAQDFLQEFIPAFASMATR